MAKEEKWIQGAIKRPGALKEYAKKHGGLNKEGDIDMTWARKLAAKLRKKEDKTEEETRLLRQLNLFFSLRSMGGK